MYASPYNHTRPYTGQATPTHYCPICGSTGQCLDAVDVPMPYPPVDPDDAALGPTGGPLARYLVTTPAGTTVMQLNAFDAARYNGAAVLI